MPNAVAQWTVAQFWNQAQSLKSGIDGVEARLNANKADLQAIYTQMRINMDPSRDAFVAPLIHQNTVLRISYLAPIKAKYNEAVTAAKNVLAAAGYGYMAPYGGGLAGLGLGPLVVPIVAVSAVLVGLTAYAIVYRLTEAQIIRTNTVKAIMTNPSTTMEQKAAQMKLLQDEIKTEGQNTPPPLGFDVKALVPVLGLVALIVLGPSLVRAFSGGRQATA